MVPAMSDAPRSFLNPGLTLLVGMVVGGLAGVYGTRLVDGQAPKPVDPSPSPVRECPPCPERTPCPTCPDCSGVSMLPTGEDDPTVVDLEDLPEDPGADRAAPPPPAGPGLPARAIQQASAAVRVAIEPCLESDTARLASGMLLLDLTVTATGSEGFVADALITQRSGDVDAVEACVQQEARRARFPYEGPDGTQRVKLPVKIGGF